MNTRLLTSLIVAVGIGAAGCTTTKPSENPGAATAASGTMAQYKCADRNGDDYIGQSELVHLRQCGIGEDLKCGTVPDASGEPPPRADFDLGLRFLQITDADNDDRISKLEFRAHCNKAASSK